MTLASAGRILSVVVLGAATNALVAQSLTPAQRAKIDSLAAAELKTSGAPSISIAVVKDGAIAYAKAYGDARISPRMPATTAMRYSIGSVSKQVTATAILMLAEEGKLSINDKVSRFFPDLTRANEITIRQLLSMTSGYQDYWPQDYVMPPMKLPTTPRAIMDTWAKKPLDFEPGSKYQYSNTNYVILGAIIEKASGMGVVDFIRQRVLTPLKMTSVQITDDGALGPTDPERYERFGLGPLRVAPKEGNGWMYAAGELAMTPTDLAKWDISVIDKALLKPESYRTQQTATILTDGRASNYALGVITGSLLGHRMISHGGEVSGFTTQNNIFPDDRAAVAVTANLFVTSAPGNLASSISTLLFQSTDATSTQALDLARKVFTDFQQGRIDRSKFTDNANAFFTPLGLNDLKSSLGPCGKLTDISQAATSLRGGMTYRAFNVRCGTKSYSVSTFFTPDGKIEQYLITP
jgi:CubicO group peptidase (beta-lactamase class C family)